MTHLPLLRDVAALAADAWQMTADAFAAAELLPLFAIWGLGLSAVEAVAWLDDRADTVSAREHSPTSAPLKA